MKKSEIKGAITHDRIILFYTNFYLMKFLYYGKIEESNDSENYQLIHLTGDFAKFSQEGNLDEYSSNEVYKLFRKYCLEDINSVFNLFEAHDIRMKEEVIIKFKDMQEFENYKTYSFKLRNENLSGRTLEQNLNKLGQTKKINNFNISCNMNKNFNEVIKSENPFTKI